MKIYCCVKYHPSKLKFYNEPDNYLPQERDKNVCVRYSVSIKVSDINNLRSGNWLNDIILNFITNFINEREDYKFK